MRPHEATPTQLVELVRPFVGARLPDYTKPIGAPYPERTSFIDINAHGTIYRDARVDEMSQDGVQVVTMGGASVVPLRWCDITVMVVRGADGSCVAYRSVAEKALAA